MHENKKRKTNTKNIDRTSTLCHCLWIKNEKLVAIAVGYKKNTYDQKTMFSVFATDTK